MLSMLNYNMVSRLNYNMVSRLNYNMVSRLNYNMASRLKKEDEYHGVDDATMLLEPILFMNYVLVNC